MSLLTSRRPGVGLLPPVTGTVNRRALTAKLVLLDVTIIVLTSIFAIVLRETIPFPYAAEVSQTLLPFAIAIPIAWLVLLSAFGAYDFKWLGNGMAEYNRVLAGSFGVMAAVGIGGYLFNYPLSRGFYLVLFLLGGPLLVVGRFYMRRRLNRMRAEGRAVTPTILVGRAGPVADLLTILRRERWLGYSIEGLLLPNDEPDPTFGEVPVLGTPEDAVQTLRRTGASAVIFADGSFDRAGEFSLLARELEDLDAQTIFVPAVADICAGRLQTRPVAGIPLIFIERPYAARAGSWMKRFFDICGAGFGLLLAAPLLAVVALLIKATDGGPVLFRQTRVGIGNRPFTCYKLRSMVMDAEAQLAKLAAQNEGSGVLFKMAHDPRVTPIGRFIRRYSIDEVPQLFNVLKGDMSLVGPRPALPAEVDQYERHVLRRLAVRPGLSGLWQVSGRSNLSWDDTVRLDLYYVDNWSFMQDINILLRTVGVVLKPTGAY